MYHVFISKLVNDLNFMVLYSTSVRPFWKIRSTLESHVLAAIARFAHAGPIGISKAMSKLHKPVRLNKRLYKGDGAIIKYN